MPSVLAVSDPVAPGARKVVIVLVPSSAADVDLRPVGVWMNPPTAAAFDQPERIDVLTMGETLDECGHCAASVRLVVHNRSSAPARFVAQIELAPDVAQVERRLVEIVQRDWRAAYDAAKASA